MTDQISHLTWKKFLKKKTPQFVGVSLVTSLLIATIILSEGITLTTDYSNLELPFMLLIITSSLAFLFLLGGILKLYLLGNLEGMGIRSDDRGLQFIRLIYFSTMIILFVTGLYCLLDVAIQEAYLQLGPVLLIKIVLDSTNTQIPGLSELDGLEFYQTARNGLFGIIFYGIIILLIISLISLLTKAGRGKVFQLLKKSDRFADLTEEETIKSDITFLRVILFIILPPVDLFIISKLQSEESELWIIWIPILIFTGILWLYILYKTIDDFFLKGVKVAPNIVIFNVLLILPVIFCFWFLPVLLAGFNEIIIKSTTFDIASLLSYFFGHLLDV